MSKPVIFVGPTLTVDEARTILDATYPGPAVQGDVHRAIAAGVPMIGLIDGLWGSQATTWHCELRHAMARGVRCYGAGSLGALRAAELQGFGMVGVGTVYEAFRSGALEDDDEVAVAHAGAEEGWRALSAPMVDLRATVAAAVRADVIDAARADKIIRAAKARHFADRIWPHTLPRVSVKAHDARAMLVRMREDLAQDAPWAAPAAWEPTDAWVEAWERDTRTEAPLWVAAAK
jgi:hypothetical protein